MTADLIAAEDPDAIVLATGALPYDPESLDLEEAHAVEAWDLLCDKANVGASVVIADWRPLRNGLVRPQQFPRAMPCGRPRRQAHILTPLDFSTSRGIPAGCFAAALRYRCCHRRGPE